MERPRLFASFFSSETGSFSQVLVNSTVEASVRALCRRGVDESCLSPDLAWREARSIVGDDEDEVEESGENRTNNVEQRSKKDGTRPEPRATCADRYFDGGNISCSTGPTKQTRYGTRLSVLIVGRSDLLFLCIV